MYSPTTILLFILLFFTYATDAHITKIQTAYDVLQEYHLPVGLLPASVRSYTLNKQTGEFIVKLGKKCAYKSENNHVIFNPTISGVISKDKVTKMKGIGARVMLVWFEIKETIRHKDEVVFSVGLLLSVGFKVKEFEESPRCGCGFDCDALEMKGEKKMVKLSKLLDWSV